MRRVTFVVFDQALSLPLFLLSLRHLLQVFLSPAAPLRDATPDDLIRAARILLDFTGKSVTAAVSGKPKEITSSGNNCRKATLEFFIIAKAMLGSMTDQQREQFVQSANEIARSVRQLLASVISVRHKA